MDRQNTNPGGGGGMERNPMSAGPANTPDFERSGQTRGMESAGRQTETERELERTRDEMVEATSPVMVEKAAEAAKEAAPILQEKAKEAMQETTQRMQGEEGREVREQLKRTATAAQHDAQRMAKEKIGEAGQRVESQANRLKDRAASGIETAAHRLDEVADRQTAGATGARAKAGEMAHGTADTLESTARYLRTNDVRGLQHDLERMTREKPVQTLLVAVAAGWVLGKILR